MEYMLAEQFAKAFTEIILEEFEDEISAVAVISYWRNMPHILVITNSNDQTAFQETTDLIIATSREVAHDFAEKFHVILIILSLADIRYYSDFWGLRDGRPDLDEGNSVVALIEVKTQSGGIRTLHTFCRHSETDVLYDDGSFEGLLKRARSYH